MSSSDGNRAQSYVTPTLSRESKRKVVPQIKDKPVQLTRTQLLANALITTINELGDDLFKAKADIEKEEK